MNEALEFSIPEPLRERMSAIMVMKSLTKAGFVDLCLFGLQLRQDYPQWRKGIAYHIAGVGLADDGEVGSDSDLLAIAKLFSELQLPEEKMSMPEAELWMELSTLVQDAAHRLEDEETEEH